MQDPYRQVGIQFEQWGLPIWKDEAGKYVHEGRRQLMINGESYPERIVSLDKERNAACDRAVDEHCTGGAF